MLSRRYWIGLSLWFVGLGLWQVPIKMRVATVGAGVLLQLVAAWVIIRELVRVRRSSGQPMRALPYALLVVAVAGLVAGLVFVLGMRVP